MDDKSPLPPLTVNTFSPHFQYPKPIKYFLDEFQSPETWFLMIETSFPERKLVASRDKFNFILPLVPTEIIAKLSFTIKTTTSPSCDDPYNTFKSALLLDTMPTKSELFNQYFKTQTLGNVLPSKFLAKCISDLENLQTGSSKDESTLRHFFLSALPIQTQQILSILTTASIQELALSADRMAEVTQAPNISVASISPKVADLFNTTEMTNAIVTLTNKINSLESQMQSNQKNYNHNHNSNFRSRPRNYSPSFQTRNNSRSHSRSHSTHNKKICYFHYKFGDQAKLCNLGCEHTEHKNSNCKQLDTCIYHARYKQEARNCIKGCKYNKTEEDPKN